MVYNQYNGRCVGRLMHFLYEYTHRSESWIFQSDNKSITDGQNGPVCCTYKWLANTDIPLFEFQKGYEHFNDNNQRVWEEMGWGHTKVETVDQNEKIAEIKRKVASCKIKAGAFESSCKELVEEKQLFADLLKAVINLPISHLEEVVPVGYKIYAEEPVFDENKVQITAWNAWVADVNKCINPEPEKTELVAQAQELGMGYDIDYAKLHDFCMAWQMEEYITLEDAREDYKALNTSFNKFKQATIQQKWWVKSMDSLKEMENK